MVKDSGGWLNISTNLSSKNKKIFFSVFSYRHVITESLLFPLA